MDDQTDLIKLYSEKILEFAANTPLTEPLNDPDGQAKKRSPVCGSSISVYVNETNGVVTEFGQDVKACALGQASASILGNVVVGSHLDELITATNELRLMLVDNAPSPTGKFENLKYLQPASEYKNRHSSILLAFEATVEALECAANKKTAP